MSDQIVHGALLVATAITALYLFLVLVPEAVARDPWLGGNHMSMPGAFGIGTFALLTGTAVAVAAIARRISASGR